MEYLRTKVEHQNQHPILSMKFVNRSTKEAMIKKIKLEASCFSVPFEKTIKCPVKRGTSPKGKEVGTNTQMKNRSELTHIQYPELSRISLFNVYLFQKSHRFQCRSIIFPKNHITPLKYMQNLTRT